MNYVHRFFFLFALLLLLAGCTPDTPVPEGFRIEPGLSLTLVAAEPLVFDPVDIRFTERGATLVLEMPGYPDGEAQSRIVLLKDTDGDGRYDERSVYADSLRLASAILPYGEGVLVAAPPYLLHIRDTDQDERADAVDTLLGGFATGNLQHNFNGLSYGLDGWILAANGGNSGQPYWWGDPASAIDLRGQDLRFNLTTREMERLGESSGGFGLGVDEWGQVFQTHNLEHVSQLVFPDRYLRGKHVLPDHTLLNISDHEEHGLARIYPIGEQETRLNHPEQSGYFSGACGITYYGGGALGRPYERTVWVADVVLNLVHVDRIEPAGSARVARRLLPDRDVLASSDRAFRPVNLRVGPNGDLYVVDMHRDVIEHPEWIPDEIEAGLDLDAGKEKGRIYRIGRPRTRAAFDFATLGTTRGQIANLLHANQWVRTTAHRLLAAAELAEADLQRLRGLLDAESAPTRLHALWQLRLHDRLSTDELRAALRDPEPGVRENALRIAEDLLSDPAVARRVLELLPDADQRVRMQAALSLSRLPAEAFARYRPELLPALAAAAALPADTWNVAALTLAAQPAAAELFAGLIARPDASRYLDLLASLAYAGSRTGADLPRVLNALVAAELEPAAKQALLAPVTRGLAVAADTTALLPALRDLEATGDAGLISELARWRQRLGLAPAPAYLALSRAARDRVGDTSLPDSVRRTQLALLELLPYAEKAEVLYSCLRNTEALLLQEAALRQLSVYREPEIGRRIVAGWKDLGPQARRWAGDLLLYIDTHHDALLTGLEEGTINVGEMNFDLERRRTLLWWTDNEDTQRRAAALFSDAGVTRRADAIAQLRGALELAGSPARGRAVFRAQCASCHVYGMEGEAVGPVLTEIGRKSKASLLHDILDPNAAVDPRYVNHRLETTAGQVHLGIIETETDDRIVLKKMGGETVAVAKADIRALTSLGTSLMMEGLEANLPPRDMADLLAFLQNN